MSDPADFEESLRRAVAPTRLQRLSIAMFRLLGSVVFRWILRIRVENPPRLRGPFVIVANHTSFLDPLILGTASPRHINFLMTQTIWRGRGLGWFYRWMRAIPLAARGSNREALRAAREILARGEVLGIFPEGGISRDGGLMLGSPGAVSLVLGEEVAVVPCGIIGAHATLPFGGKKLTRHGIVVRFGTPLAHSELVDVGGGRKDRLAAATRRIMREIGKLSQQPAREDQLERKSALC